MLDAVSCVALAGVCAEYLQFGVAEGGISDIQQLDFLYKSLGFTQSKSDDVFARSRATDRAAPAAPRSDPIQAAPFSPSGSDGAEGGDAWARGFFPPRVVQVLDVLAQESGADRRGLVVDKWRKDVGKDGGKVGGGDGGSDGGRDEGSGRVAQRLERLGLTLTGRDVSTVLRESADWRMTVAFFDWARKQESFRPSTYVYNLVLAALGKGRQWGRMKELLTEMTQKGVELDNVTYSTIISSATRADQHELVLQWLQQIVITAFGEAGGLMRATGWRPDAGGPARASAAVAAADGVGDCPRPGLLRHGHARPEHELVLKWLEQMAESECMPDQVSYATVMHALGRAGRPGDAVRLFERMRATGWRPDAVTYATIITAFGEAGGPQEAYDLWKEMKRVDEGMGVRGAGVWKRGGGESGGEEEGVGVGGEGVVSGREKSGLSSEAVKEAAEEAAVEGATKAAAPGAGAAVPASATTAPPASPAAAAAAAPAAPAAAAPAFARLVTPGVYHATLNVLAKAWRDQQAEIVFRTMQQDPHVPVTTEAVTIMMALYTEKGEVEKALALAEEMREVYLAGEGAYNEDGSRAYNEDGTAAGTRRSARDGPFRPDATFYSVILQACRECGLVEEARRAYAGMKRDGVVLTENSVRQLAGLFAEKGGRGGAEGEAGNAGSAVAGTAVAGTAVAGLAGTDPAVAEVEALLADARAAGIYLGGRSTSRGDRSRGSGSEEYLGLGVDLSGLSAVPTKAFAASQGMVAVRKLLLDCLKEVDPRIHELVVVGLGEALEKEVDDEEGEGVTGAAAGTVAAAATAAAAAAGAAEGTQSAAKSPAAEQGTDPTTLFTTLLDRTVAGVHPRDQKPLCNNLLSLLFLFDRRELSVAVLKAMVSTRQIARLFSRDWPHWTLHLSGLSYHGAQVALRYWLELVAGAVEAGKRLPREMEIEVGVGRSRKRHLRGAVVPELARLGSPFQSDEDRPRLVVAKGAEVAAWVKKTPELWSGRGGGVGSGGGGSGNGGGEEGRVVRGRWERSEGEGVKKASMSVDGKESDSNRGEGNKADGRASADLTAPEAVAGVEKGVRGADDEEKKDLGPESGGSDGLPFAAATGAGKAAGEVVGQEEGKSEPVGEVLEKDGFKAYQIAGGTWVKECVCGERSSSRKQRCQNKACGRHLPTMAQFREGSEC
ncbi:unnamed protein product [Closterium sp. Naga37s-1]|nr:unnamed protein product [Closterium sp. Naga37s-1]